MKASDIVLISVIMPVFNSSEFLKEAIDSILIQTHSKLELLIIYDESTDSSLEIINGYCARDSRVKLLIGNRQGISGALNIGIDGSNGQFIARMDSDDICDCERLQRQVHLLESNNLDICGGHSVLIDNSGRMTGISISPLSHEGCTLCLGFEVPFFHPAVMFKKSFVQEHKLRYGQSQYKAAEDYDLWVRMHEAGALFGNVDAVVLKYRVLKNSLSRNNPLMLIDSKALANNFFNKNYIYCLKKLEFIAEFGNAGEKSLTIMFIWRSLFRKGNFLVIKYFKFIDNKTSAYATLSQIVRTLGYRG